MTETEARRNLGRSKVPDLQHGNKFILPSDDFATFQQNAMRRGDDKHFIGDNAMTFEMQAEDGPMAGVKAYCGVLQWTAPSGTVIVPDSFMFSMGGPFCQRLRVRHAVLPQVQKAWIMPHSEEDIKEINSSIGARMFLETAVTGRGGGRGYTTLQVGQTISLAAAGKTIEATVTKLSPDVPAVTLWSDYSVTMPLDFMEPRNRTKCEDDIASVPSSKQIDAKTTDYAPSQQSIVSDLVEATKYDSSKTTVIMAVHFPDGVKLRVKCNPSTATSDIFDRTAEFASKTSWRCGPNDFFDLAFGGDRLLQRSSETIESVPGLLKRRRNKTSCRGKLEFVPPRSKRKDASKGRNGLTMKTSLVGKTFDGFVAGEPAFSVLLLLHGIREPLRFTVSISQTVKQVQAYVKMHSKLNGHNVPSCLVLVMSDGRRVPFSDVTCRLTDLGVGDGAQIEEVVESLSKCDVCGKTTKELKTYTVNWERLCLCGKHKVGWLDELLDGGEMDEEDMRLLSKKFVLDNLYAAELL
eukprot:g3493.t1